MANPTPRPRALRSATAADLSAPNLGRQRPTAAAFRPLDHVMFHPSGENHSTDNHPSGIATPLRHNV
ncbi:MAG TPA: hypothetical protein VHH15_22185, partial [Actinophytocola sp.]|nr:hypothetical protein [Actinophytocola sp.]